MTKEAEETERPVPTSTLDDIVASFCETCEVVSVAHGWSPVMRTYLRRLLIAACAHAVQNTEPPK